MIKRRYIRFEADQGTVGQISSPTTGDVAGLLITESHGGCSMVIAQPLGIVKGEKCSVKVGTIGPLKSEVAWIKELEDNIFTVGLKFLE